MPPGRIPLAWQDRAADETRALIKAGEQRILIPAATGTGKGSLAAAFIVACCRARLRTLFIVHLDELIEDVMERCLQIEPRLYSGKVKGPQNEVDRQAVFASMQTLQGDRLLSLWRFDYVFYDEAHMSDTPTGRAIIERVFSVNERAILIGFTATPFRSGSAGRTKGLGKVFKAATTPYSLEDGIKDGILAPLLGRVVDTHLDLTGVDPDDEKKIARIVDTPERNKAVLEAFLRERPERQAIGFAASIEHAKNLAAVFSEAGIAASWVSGLDPQRKEKIRAFKADKIHVLWNQNLLTTGFDHPPIETVMLVRPTKSLLMLSQMVGRGTRVHRGKPDCIILDFVANTQGFNAKTMIDLTIPPPNVRITVGCVVRHRDDEELEEGTVLELLPDEAAHVCWAGVDGRDGPFPTSDLVLLRPPRVPETLTLTPSVIGTTTFTIALYGENAGRKIGWYRYESARYGKIDVARGEGVAVLLVPVEPKSHQWKCIAVRKAWGARSWAELVHEGPYHEVQARAATVIDKPLDWNKDWIGDPASDRQLAALKRFKLRREHVSKGEAALLLDLKIGLLCAKEAGIHG